MLTRKRDLRTGQPVWTTSRRPPVAHAPLTRDVETEVLVVGAGISGALGIAAAGGALLLWIAVPIALGARFFRRKDF